MNNISFPTWSAPIIGAIAGGLIALSKQKKLRTEAEPYQLLLYGALLGAAAGSVMLFYHWLKKVHKVNEEGPKYTKGKYYASVLLFIPSIYPLLGLPFGITSFLLSRNSTISHKKVGLYSLFFSIVFPLFLFTLAQLL